MQGIQIPNGLPGLHSHSFSPLASGLHHWPAASPLGEATFAVGAVPAHDLSSPHRTRAGGSSSFSFRHNSRAAAAGREQSRLANTPTEPPLIEVAQDERGEQEPQSVRSRQAAWCLAGPATTDPPAQQPPQLAEQQAQQTGQEGQDGERQQPEVVRPMSQLTARSRQSSMDADLRSSWGSDRSAEITQPWEEMRLGLGEGQHLRYPLGAAEGAGALEGSLPVLRQSTDSLSSLEGPACSERQASILPLHTSLLHGSGSDHSQLSSPNPEALAHAKAGRGFFGSKPRHGSAPRRSCFSCASPFGGCRRRPQDDEEEDEVVRRNTSDATEFVIHGKSQLASTQAAGSHACPPQLR